MKKKILIITPFFAPETHAAVFRTHKLAKYLNRENWEVHVLTVDTNYVYNEDENLLKELEGVTIHRSKYIEPTLRGLRMWLTGKDRTFKTLKKKGFYADNSAAPNDVAKEKPSPNWKLRVYTYILERYSKNPDRYWTWKKGAIKTTEKLIKEHQIDLIYTTCLPFTTNSIGIALRKKCNVKWVADFRDPITYGKRMYSSNQKIFAKQKRIQDLTFKWADHVTVLSSAYELIFHDQYEGVYNNKITFIPTGLDDDYLPNGNSEEDSDLVFVGEYLKEYEDHFLKLLSKVLLNQKGANSFKVKIIGNSNINRGNLIPLLKNHQLEDYFEFIDHMPQIKLYEIIKSAKFTVLLAGENTLWWTNFAKLVDYIALNKQVIAMVPNISEARSELTKAGLGIFVKDDDASVSLLQSILMERVENVLDCNIEYCKKYLASSQTKSFIKVFESL